MGLKEPGRSRGVVNGRSVVPEHLWSVFAAQLEAQGAEVIYTDDLHPLVRMRLAGESHVRRLRRLPVVEYVEPALFDERTFALEGKCGPGDIYLTGRAVTPGDRLAFTLQRHRVDRAWPYATGQGIKLGVIDTGTSHLQPQLTSQFATGQSTGRTIVHHFTKAHGGSGPDWTDTCWHGTKTLGLMASPRNGSNTVGVAYGADAYAVRALNDPAIAWGGWLEVREAVIRAAGPNQAKIVNMSFGSLMSNTSTRHAIELYANNPPHTLFFGAAGTGVGIAGAVFPSSLNAVVAVTGLDPATPFPYSNCSDCNTSGKVEFSAFVHGEVPGISGTQPTGYGGSSAATALTSGIAALVWSRYPSWTREDVLARMRAAAPFATRERGIGHGPVNAVCAVGGICSATVSGPSQVSHGQTVTLSVNPRVLDSTVRARLTYIWPFATGTGRTVQHTVTACPGETAQFSVTVRDPVTNAAETFVGSYTVLDDGTPVTGLCESTPPLEPDPNWP